MPNWDLVAGTWRQWKSQALVWWIRLTEPEWDEINGDREKLLALLQLKYGWTRPEAEKELETRFEEFKSTMI
jgi:uncharacterized protein YjbJ (UPF0337 family)